MSTLFAPPDDLPGGDLAAAGKVKNDLTKPERDSLVCGGEFRGARVRGVLPLCKRLANLDAFLAATTRSAMVPDAAPGVAREFAEADCENDLEAMRSLGYRV